jgi:O-antigen ligase
VALSSSRREGVGRRVLLALSSEQGRACSAAALGISLVATLGFADGGYYGASWTALTVALVAIVGLAALREPRVQPTRLGLSMLALLTGLGLWTALSSTWATPAALDRIEARRLLLYVVALAAVLSIVERRTRRPFLAGLLGGITVLGLVGVAYRTLEPRPFDPFYGNLLEEPVGYPNALGILAAIGVVLAIGIALEPGAGWMIRPTRAVGAVLVVVLGLTGSRGAALALVLGLCVALLLSNARRSLVGETMCVVVLGTSAWFVADVMGSRGIASLAGVAIAVGAAAALPSRLWAPGRRIMLVVLAATMLAVATAVAIVQPSTTSSFRTAYWGAAIEGARAHPLLGSGAGSFRITWLEYRQVETNVRDAHSLYLETLSELGPLGLLLVLGLVAVPLVAAVRHRREPFVPIAAATFVAFAAHAAIDWDWEMPVVMFAAFGGGGAILAGGPRSGRALAVGAESIGKPSVS